MNLEAEPSASVLQKHGLRPNILLYSTNTCFVYQVADERRGTTAVLKLILRPASCSPEVAEREVVNQWRCKHPSIVEMFDCFWYWLNETYWIGAIEMERMQTDLLKDIENRAKNGYPWMENQLFQFLMEIVDALACAQDIGIAHRDIKPGNLFLHCGAFKIGDFGSSREIRSMVDQFSNVGTQLYLSPVLRRANRCSQVVHNPFKSDVFSLGLTLLHMATLKAPSLFADLETMIQKSIAELQYSDRLKNWIAWMLIVEEEDRPDFATMRKYLRPIEASVQQEQEENVFASMESTNIHLSANQSLVAEQSLPQSSENQEISNPFEVEKSIRSAAQKCSHIKSNPKEPFFTPQCGHVICRLCAIEEKQSLSYALRVHCSICNYLFEYPLSHPNVIQQKYAQVAEPIQIEERKVERIRK